MAAMGALETMELQELRQTIGLLQDEVSKMKEKFEERHDKVVRHIITLDKEASSIRSDLKLIEKDITKNAMASCTLTKYFAELRNRVVALEEEGKKKDELMMRLENEHLLNSALTQRLVPLVMQATPTTQRREEEGCTGASGATPTTQHAGTPTTQRLEEEGCSYLEGASRILQGLPEEEGCTYCNALHFYGATGASGPQCIYCSTYYAPEMPVQHLLCISPGCRFLVHPEGQEHGFPDHCCFDCYSNNMTPDSDSVPFPAFHGPHCLRDEGS